MSAIDLEIQKLKFVKEFLNEEDEDIVKRQLSFFYEAKQGMDGLKKKPKRELGTLKGKGSVTFAEDFKMTDEELVNL
jgi:hypothetical protein